MNHVKLMLQHVTNKIKIIIMGHVLGTWIFLSRWIPNDKLFLKVYYFLKMKENLKFKNPQSYTQKLQVLKLLNIEPLYSLLVDKYSVKQIVSDKIGSQFIIPLLGVWNSFHEIDFDRLPTKFVLKTTHDSGTVFICTNKKELDLKQLKSTFIKALKTNYFYKSREYPYKNITPRIIAEMYLHDESQPELIDYKFFCFRGEPKFLQITSIKDHVKTVSYFDIEFNPLDIKTGDYDCDKTIEKPENYFKMVEIARLLAKDIIHVRIDLYNIQGQIYFGEYTFHNNGGIMNFTPKEWNKIWGDLIVLPDIDSKPNNRNSN